MKNASKPTPADMGILAAAFDDSISIGYGDDDILVSMQAAAPDVSRADVYRAFAERVSALRVSGR